MPKAVLAPAMEAPVPDIYRAFTDDADLHLLVGDMKDELSAYRWREAIWISIVVHLLVFLSWIFAPKWMPRSAVIVPMNQTAHQQLTFLELPQSQSSPKIPQTDIISSQNRIAQSRTPLPNREQLRRLLNAQPPGAPARPTPPATPAQQPAQQQAQASSQGSAQNPAAQPQQQQPPTQTAQLEQPPKPAGPSPFKAAMAPGAAVNQAIQSTATGTHGATHMSFGGDYGVARNEPTNPKGDVDILSDTMGVDFSGYLQRVIWEVKTHWYNGIPEVARPPIMKRGKLAIEFAILKNGSVAGMKLVSTSGDIALDRAAWAGISGSIPFQPLPSNFKGEYISLRFKFYYNPATNEFE